MEVPGRPPRAGAAAKAAAAGAAAAAALAAAGKSAESASTEGGQTTASGQNATSGQAAALQLAAARNRAAGGAAGDSSIVLQAVRQLEQRLETERRRTEHQLQRLERRVEELQNAAPTARWAELQGYVDGLAETVQTLVRRSEEPTVSTRGTTNGDASVCEGVQQSQQVARLDTRMGAMEKRHVEFERGRDALQEQLDSAHEQLRDLASRHSSVTGTLSTRVAELGARLSETENGLDSPTGRASMEGSKCSAPATSSAVVQRLEDQLQCVCDQVADLTGRIHGTETALWQGASGAQPECSSCTTAAPVAVARPPSRRGHPIAQDDESEASDELPVSTYEVPSEATRRAVNYTSTVPHDFQQVCEDVARLTARMEVAENTMSGGPESWGSGPANWDASGGVATSCEVEELQGDVEDQLSVVYERLAELDARVQDAERGLQDLAQDQDVRQQASHVSEQVLRLALRMQRLERGSLDGGMGESAEEARALREEVGNLGEQLVGLWKRLQQAERGLDGMAEAFGRVCEEVGELRRMQAPHSPAHVDSMAADEEAAAFSERVNGHDSQAEALRCGSGNEENAKPLQHKVGEVERGLESMEEVVWDLRKQVSGLRTQVSELQSGGMQDGMLADARQGTDADIVALKEDMVEAKHRLASLDISAQELERSYAARLQADQPRKLRA